MRLRLKRDVRMSGVPEVLLTAGSVVHVPDSVAARWIAEGAAMEDKSLDGASETTQGVEAGLFVIRGMKS